MMSTSQLSKVIPTSQTKVIPTSQLTKVISTSQLAKVIPTSQLTELNGSGNDGGKYLSLRSNVSVPNDLLNNC